MESKEIQSQLWKVLESRDRSLTKGLHRWGEQEKALVERKDEITSLKKAADEKDEEIETKDEEITSLKKAADEKDEEITLLKKESDEKDKEITSLKNTLDARLKILEEQHAELERIRSSWPYRLLHEIKHPQDLFKKKM